jgi:hypothetical protein
MRECEDEKLRNMRKMEGGWQPNYQFGTETSKRTESGEADNTLRS